RAYPTEFDPMTDTKREAPASPEKRAAALEIVLRRTCRKTLLPSSLSMPTMPGLPRTAPRWWLAHGLTPNIARACLLTARRQRASYDLSFRSTIETLLYSRTRPPFTT